MNRFALGLMTCLLALVWSAAGCGNSETDALRKGDGPTVVTWDALAALQAPEVMMGVGMNAEMGNFEGLKAHVKDPKFVDTVAAFEKEPIPSKYSSPEREAARKELIDHLNGLIEAAKSNAPGEQLKAKADAVKTSLRKVATGSES